MSQEDQSFAPRRGRGHANGQHDPLAAALDRLSTALVESANINAAAMDRQTAALKPVGEFCARIDSSWDWLCTTLRKHRVPLTAGATMLVTAVSPAAGQIIHTLLGGK